VDVDDGEVIEKKIGYYNATENLSIPKFTKNENMHKMIAKPAGNMLKLKCVAEGEFDVLKTYVLDVHNNSSRAEYQTYLL